MFKRIFFILLIFLPSISFASVYNSPAAALAACNAALSAARGTPSDCGHNSTQQFYAFQCNQTKRTNFPPDPEVCGGTMYMNFCSTAGGTGKEVLSCSVKPYFYMTCSSWGATDIGGGLCACPEGQMAQTTYNSGSESGTTITHQCVPDPDYTPPDDGEGEPGEGEPGEGEPGEGEPGTGGGEPGTGGGEPGTGGGEPGEGEGEPGEGEPGTGGGEPGTGGGEPPEESTCKYPAGTTTGLITTGSKIPTTPICINGCAANAVGVPLYVAESGCRYSVYSSTGSDCSGAATPAWYTIAQEYECTATANPDPENPPPVDPPPFGEPENPPPDGDGETPPPDGEGEGEPQPGEGEGEEPKKGYGLAQKDCEAPPQSESDPQLHAILMQVWHLQCYGEPLNKNLLKNILASDQGLKNSDDLKPDDITEDKTEAVSDAVNNALNSISDNGNGAGYCPFSNFTITVLGKSAEAPFSLLCPLIPQLRTVLILIAYIIAGTIIFRSLIDGD